MPQRQRIKNLERFRDDPHEVLIATDVAARGLDIPHVEHVIHYQVPRTAENYVHRSGRTARASREGLTILMMDPSEAYLYAKMCRTLNKSKFINLIFYLRLTELWISKINNRNTKYEIVLSK
ncbi:ATP-dependent RNA helicase mak5-like [Spodoptera litura]|uniref:ATP-dependent RNA helicase mak5-like n=1 Tax=Spodoptera litura TaxID=69820 RepID=A0A9J7DXA3_SPOLT|nr:ATP-dependent RNA helicase mak5-like [Spodoptera litura]